MSFIDNIKVTLSNLLLSRASRPEREIKTINIKDAKTLGIVYLADNEEMADLVRRYVKFLKEYKIRVKAIGYFDQKELPQDVNPKLEFDFITKKDLNLQLEPKCVEAENFVNEAFDILIDMNVEENNIMQYLTLHSRAKFKVGAQRLKYNDLFDLTIVLKEDEGCRQLMKNIDRYLHLIKAS